MEWNEQTVEIAQATCKEFGYFNCLLAGDLLVVQKTRSEVETFNSYKEFTNTLSTLPRPTKYEFGYKFELMIGDDYLGMEGLPVPCYKAELPYEVNDDEIYLYIDETTKRWTLCQVAHNPDGENDTKEWELIQTTKKGWRQED